MPIYQGIDIVSVDRMRGVLDRNEAFEQDIFTRQERRYCRNHRNPHIHFAGRFAAKEAFLKAVGTGFFAPGVFREIEIALMPSGRPFIRLSGWSRRLMERLKADEVTVSISHTRQYAVSSVILAGGQRT